MARGCKGFGRVGSGCVTAAGEAVRRFFRGRALCRLSRPGAVLGTVLALSAGFPLAAEEAPELPPAASLRAYLSDLLATMPRVAQRADALLAEGRALSHRYDLPDPRALAFEDRATDPEDLAGWQAALEGQEITAALSGRAADWLALANIALTLGEGATGIDGLAPDPFAREAWAEIAAGAALNGVLLAENDDRQIDGFGLLAWALVLGGDAGAAARLGERVRMDYGAPGNYAFDENIAFLEQVADPDLPRPADLPEATGKSLTMRTGDWVVNCSPRGDCLIATDLPEISLEIWRMAGPGAPVWIDLVLAGENWPNAAQDEAYALPKIRVTIDGQPLPGHDDEDLPVVLDAGAMEGWAFHSFDAAEVGALLDALLSGERLRVERLGKAGITPKMGVDLAPLDALFAEVDEFQRRKGSPSALIRRGPGAVVPEAPAAPLLDAPLPRPLPPEWQAEIPIESALLWQDHCPPVAEGKLDPFPDMVGQHQMNGWRITVLSCPTESAPKGTMVIWQRGKEELRWIGTDRPEILHNGDLVFGGSIGVDGAPPGPPADPAAPRRPQPVAIWASDKAEARAAPCPGGRFWVWTGEGFELAESYRLDLCRASRRAPLHDYAVVREGME